jgi:hypothetical protein
MGYPTNLPFGIATVATTEVLGSYPLPDPFHTSSNAGFGIHAFQDDFNTLSTGTYTLTGTGTPTFALGTGQGGVAVMTTTATSSDSALVTKPGKSFVITAGQDFWADFRFQVSDATNSSFLVGVIDAASQADGLYFTKANASTTVNLVSMVGSAATTLVTGVTTAANATYMDLGFYYNGTDLLVYTGGNTLVARVVAPTLTTATLTVGMQLVTGAAAAKTLTADFIFVAEEMVR